MKPGVLGAGLLNVGREAGALALQPGSWSHRLVDLPLTSCVAPGECLPLSVPQPLTWGREMTEAAGERTAGETEHPARGLRA